MKKLLSLLAVLAVSLYAAEKVYLAPISIVGMHGDYGIVSTKLMKAYMEDDGRYILVVGSAEDSVSVENQSKVRETAISKGCSKYIMAEFTRLGENVLLSFKLYNTESEAPIWSDRLKAKNPDDFDPIIQRVSRNIGTKNKAANDDDIYSVTQKETEQLTRKSVSSYLGVAVGGVFAMQPDVDALAGISIFLHYDFGYLLAGIDGSWYGVDNDLDLASLNLSVAYPFGTKAITPYLGGGLGISTTEYDSDIESSGYWDDYSDSRGGLTGFISGGVLINRNSKLLLNLNVRYLLNFYKNNIYELQKKRDGSSDIVKKSNAIQGFVVNFGIARGF